MGLLPLQGRVHPLPSGKDLTGKTVIITGGNAGLGYSAAKLLLLLHISNVILACRSTARGESAKASLLADPAVRAANPKANIAVMKVDMADYESVKAFAKAVNEEVPALNYLLLNAGLGLAKFSKAIQGHETSVQVHLLSNMLLQMELQPLLEATAAKTGEPSRVTWVGSRAHAQTTFGDNKKKPVTAEGKVLPYLDDPAKFSLFRYNDSKVLVAMVVEDLGKKIDTSGTIVNNVCPGMVNTKFTDRLPFFASGPMKVVKAVMARTEEEGGIFLVHALVFAEKSTHGEFIADTDAKPSSAFIASRTGREVQAELWQETLDEMRPYTKVPEAWSAPLAA